MNAPLCSSDPLRQPRKCELPRPLVCCEPVNRERYTRREWLTWMHLQPRKASLETVRKYEYETEMN